MMIKALIFDLGGVIVPLDFARGYATIASLCPYSAEEISRRIEQTGLMEPFEMGKVPPREFARKISQVLELRVSFEEFCEIWGSIFPPHTLIPESMLEALRGCCRLLLLSNTNAIHFPLARRKYALLRHFDDSVLSYELGVMKPSPEIYREAVARAGCRAGECFFTDDVAENVEAAKREGLNGAQFLSADQLREELRRWAIVV